MPNIRIINDPSEISLGIEWVPSSKFNSQDRIVNQYGYEILHPSNDNYSMGYSDKYKIIEKRERSFSCSERLQRGLLGVAAVVCTLGIALIFKSVRNLFTKSKETIRFAVKYQEPPKVQKLKSTTGSLDSGIGIGKISLQLPSGWKKKKANETRYVEYGVETIEIPKGSHYYTDSDGNVVIGFHGTFDPPLDMS